MGVKAAARFAFSEEAQHAPATVRSFRQIAAILSQRGGAPTTPARVERECRRAERKLARAMLAHPFFRAWLRGGPSQAD